MKLNKNISYHNISKTWIRRKPPFSFIDFNKLEEKSNSNVENELLAENADTLGGKHFWFYYYLKITFRWLECQVNKICLPIFKYAFDLYTCTCVQLRKSGERRTNSFQGEVH